MKEKNPFDPYSLQNQRSFVNHGSFPEQKSSPGLLTPSSWPLQSPLILFEGLRKM